MSFWIDDPELFLYKPYISNNAPAEIWRCKNMTASVPLNAAGFITKTPVRSRLDLVGVTSKWSEQNYKDLLAYIGEKHFLVNCKGEIFVENFPYNSVPSIDPSNIMYLRAADAINMQKFGFPSPPKLPIRKIMYLDLNPVTDAEMMPPPTTTIKPKPPPPPIKPKPPPTIKDGRPKFDPSWMTNNWESDWVDINGLERKYAITESALVEVTKAGFQFVDDNTTNVGRDYFSGVKATFSRGTENMPWVVVDGLGVRIIQARFNPKIWGTFHYKQDRYPVRDSS